MKPGQRLTRWWQDFTAGRLRTPQAVYAAAQAENTENPSDRFFGPPIDDGIKWDAPARLRSPQYFYSDSDLRHRERADWRGCDPRLMFWAAYFIKAAARRGIPLYVHCALRDKAEQDRVFKAGHSKAPYPRSAHNIGEAVDIVHGRFHWDMTPAEWALLHTLGRLSLDRVNAQLGKDKLQLVWGGSFRSLYDPAHWEVSDYRQRLGPRSQGDPIRLSPYHILQRHRHGGLREPPS